MIVKSDYFFLTIAVYILLCSVCKKCIAMHLKDFLLHYVTFLDQWIFYNIYYYFEFEVQRLHIVCFLS